jgi:hypothetical protein
MLNCLPLIDKITDVVEKYLFIMIRLLWLKSSIMLLLFFFKLVKKRFLTFKERRTLQACYQLWSTVRLSILYIDSP